MSSTALSASPYLYTAEGNSSVYNGTIVLNYFLVEIFYNLNQERLAQNLEPLHFLLANHSIFQQQNLLKDNKVYLCIDSLYKEGIADLAINLYQQNKLTPEALYQAFGQKVKEQVEAVLSGNAVSLLGDSYEATKKENSSSTSFSHYLAKYGISLTSPGYSHTLLEIDQELEKEQKEAQRFIELLRPHNMNTIHNVSLFTALTRALETVGESQLYSRQDNRFFNPYIQMITNVFKLKGDSFNTKLKKNYINQAVKPAYGDIYKLSYSFMNILGPVETRKHISKSVLSNAFYASILESDSFELLSLSSKKDMIKFITQTLGSAQPLIHEYGIANSLPQLFSLYEKNSDLIEYRAILPFMVAHKNFSIQGVIERFVSELRPLIPHIQNFPQDLEELKNDLWTDKGSNILYKGLWTNMEACVVKKQLEKQLSNKIFSNVEKTKSHKI